MTEREQMREWVRTWKQAGPELERIRIEEMRASDPSDTARAFTGLSLLKNLPDRPLTGLIEQQALFARLRPRE